MNVFKFFAYVLYARGEFYAGGTAHHFPGGRFKLKMAHKSLQVGDMADEDIKTFYKKLERVVTFWGTFSDSHRWGNVIFFGLFWENSNATGGRFGNNPGRRGEVF